jgi:uncharacterized protein YyaL (SSP411 family)
MQHRYLFHHPLQHVVSGHPRRWLEGTVGIAVVGWCIAAGLHLAPGASAQDKTQPRDIPPLHNDLAQASSPYLRSAAQQPVAWQQWGPKAFALAATLDRPIWLDIGAIWCHWCHVMDRESYEHPEIAALINQHFVPIKVDRDERPDIDARYQAAHAALNGRGGGWPLTMFLTPDGHPFAGATYLPPEQRGRLLGIKQIAPRVAEVYRTKRDWVVDLGRRVRAHLAASRAATAPDDLTPALVQATVQDIAAQLDPQYGGFGKTEGPKFPHAEAIRLALATAFLTDDVPLQQAALQTLKAYATSGMRDPVHGGFFRYSMDRALTVPHFEKMDYVQAALLQAYLDAYRLTGDALYADVARDIMRYLDRTLSDRVRGGFYAHQDADVSLDDDGSYYTWSLAQLRTALPDEQAEVLRLAYGIEATGEMREHPAQNVLRLLRPPGEVARLLGLPEEEARRRLQTGTQALEAVRRQQRAPLVEPTKFTNRNAMLIAAYLDAYTTLGDTAARDFALKSLDFLLATAVRPDGRVWHATSAETSYVEGLAADYVGLADALLDAYQVRGRPQDVQLAEQILDRAVQLFWDPKHGGFYDRPADPAALALLADRAKIFADSPLPGDNAVAARALDKLYLLTSADRWRDLAEQTLTVFAGAAEDRGPFTATYAMAVEAHLHKPPQVVIIGPRPAQPTQALTEAAWRTYRPGRLVASYDPRTVALEALPPAVAGAARVFKHDATARAYVCVGETCAPPTTLPEEVATLVRDYGRVGPR